jgi:hypothetical protein
LALTEPLSTALVPVILVAAEVIRSTPDAVVMNESTEPYEAEPPEGTAFIWK